MKTLLDVTKTLLLINGVIVLPSLLLFKSMYQQQMFPKTEVAQGNDSAWEFHRNLNDETPNYQQELEKTKQQLEQFKTETHSQISALQTALKNSQPQNPVNVTVAPISSPNQPTVETVAVSQPIKLTQAPKPSIKKPILAKKVNRASSPKPSPITNFQKAEPVAPPQEAIVPKKTEVKESSPLPQPSQSQNEKNTVYPEGYISSNHLPAIKRNASNSNPASDDHALEENKSIKLATLLHEGLVVADNKNHINPGTANYKKVRKAIDTLNNGQSQTLEEAAKSSGIESKVLVQVKKWGENYDQSRQLAHEIQVGLTVADKENQLTYGTSNYKKVQTAIVSLRNGTSKNLEDAARLSGIDLSVLTQLAKWGKNRPGSYQIASN
ncbi:MAG: hypothetical protein QNJ64_10905 [Crocosphaera sp.]|nr:hypothetical protein [Crocosphaera sp.]